MAMNLEDFNFLSDYSVDNMLVYQEGSLQVTGTPNAAHYAYQQKDVWINTGIDSLLFPTLLVSTDGNRWFDINGSPVIFISSTIASGYTRQVSGGVISTKGEFHVVMTLPAQYNGALYYRVWGTEL